MNKCNVVRIPLIHLHRFDQNAKYQQTGFINSKSHRPIQLNEIYGTPLIDMKLMNALTSSYKFSNWLMIVFARSSFKSFCLKIID